VSGDVVNDFVVRVLEGDEDGYTYNSGVLTFASDGAYEVSMADGVDVATDVIVVASGVTAEVRINGLNIDPSNDSAFSVAAGAVCELVLMGDNEFIETEAYANVHVPADAAITIVGDGSLNVINSSEGAGIGGVVVVVELPVQLQSTVVLLMLEAFMERVSVADFLVPAVQL
jgi:hypothetical protein